MEGAVESSFDYNWDDDNNKKLLHERQLFRNDKSKPFEIGNNKNNN